MHNFTITTKSALSSDAKKKDDSIEQQLLEIYWHKKDLESYLPGIAKYSSATEICRITLSQLEKIEKLTVAALLKMSKRE